MGIDEYGRAKFSLLHKGGVSPLTMRVFALAVYGGCRPVTRAGADIGGLCPLTMRVFALAVYGGILPGDGGGCGTGRIGRVRRPAE